MMFSKNETPELKTKSQRDEARADEQLKLKKAELGLSALTAGLSAISVGIAIASLNKKKKSDGQPIYYMSESMGLIKWE